MSSFVVGGELPRVLELCARALRITGNEDGAASASLALQVRNAQAVIKQGLIDCHQEIYEAVRECAIALGIKNDEQSAAGPEAAEIRRAIRKYESVMQIPWDCVKNPSTGIWEVLDTLRTVIASVNSHALAQLIASAPTMHKLLWDAVDEHDEMNERLHAVGMDPMPEEEWLADSRHLASTLDHLVEIEEGLADVVYQPSSATAFIACECEDIEVVDSTDTQESTSTHDSIRATFLSNVLH